MSLMLGLRVIYITKLETFNFSETNTGELILYNTFGENDIQILNVQLNSYVNIIYWLIGYY